MGVEEDYFFELKKAIDNIDYQEIKKITNVLRKAREEEKTIYLIGNGGSASTASHFACDLSKGTVKDCKSKRFKVYSLTDNPAILSAYGNDVGYDSIFVEPLKNLLIPQDILIAITASGNSKNVLNAIDYAKTIKATPIGFLGFDGGKAAKLLEHKIIIKSNNYGIIEDLHLSLEHVISQNLRE